MSRPVGEAPVWRLAGFISWGAPLGCPSDTGATSSERSRTPPLPSPCPMAFEFFASLSAMRSLSLGPQAAAQRIYEPEKSPPGFGSLKSPVPWNGRTHAHRWCQGHSACSQTAKLRDGSNSPWPHSPGRRECPRRAGCGGANSRDSRQVRPGSAPVLPEAAQLLRVYPARRPGRGPVPNPPAPLGTLFPLLLTGQLSDEGQARAMPVPGATLGTGRQLQEGLSLSVLLQVLSLQPGPWPGSTSPALAGWQEPSQ